MDNKINKISKINETENQVFAKIKEFVSKNQPHIEIIKIENINILNGDRYYALISQNPNILFIAFMNNKYQIFYDGKMAVMNNYDEDSLDYLINYD